MIGTAGILGVFKVLVLKFRFLFKTLFDNFSKALICLATW